MATATQQKTEISLQPINKFYTKYDRLKTGSDTVTRGKNVKFATMKFTQASKTEQQFAYETNINNIVNGAISKLPPNNSMPHYGEFPDPNTYVDSLNLIASAKSTFEGLPATIRERFGNNPENLLKFISNPDNEEEAIKLGLVKGPDYIIVEDGLKYVNGKYVGYASLDEIEKYQKKDKKDVTSQGEA